MKESSEQNGARELRQQREEVGTWGRVVKARLDAALAHSGQHVLDVGCSSGSYVTALRARGRTAFGCDLLPDDNWRRAAENPFLAADIRHLPFPDGAFDTCLAFEVLEHLADARQGLQELWRVCRKNIIISVPNCSLDPVFQQAGLAYFHWTDKTHRQQFTEESVRALLEGNGFRVDKLTYINPIMPELLVFAAWHVPCPVARFAAQAARRLPFRKQFRMTLLAVAQKVSAR